MRWSFRPVVLSALAIFLVLGAVLFHHGGVSISTPEEMTAQLRSLGIWGPLAVIGLMILHSFVPFPAELLAVCAGAVYGTLLGSALIWVGAMFGALAAFWTSRRLGQSVVRSWLSQEHANTLDRWADNQGAITLLVSRLIPVIAFNLINYAAGLTRVGLWTFVWTTGLGILPVTVLSTYLGSRMRSLDWPMLLVLSALSIAIVLPCHHLAKRRGWIK